MMHLTPPLPCRPMLLVAPPLRSMPRLLRPRLRRRLLDPRLLLLLLLAAPGAALRAAPRARSSTSASPASWPATVRSQHPKQRLETQLKILDVLALRGALEAPGADERTASPTRARRWTSRCCTRPRFPGCRPSSSRDASVASWAAALSA